MRNHEHDAEIDARLQAAREAPSPDTLAQAKARGYDQATADMLAYGEVHGIKNVPYLLTCIAAYEHEGAHAARAAKRAKEDGNE